MNNLGFRLPGDWEDHECTWLTWPQNNETWGSLLPNIEKTYTELIKIISQYEPVKLISGNSKLTENLCEVFDSSVDIINIPTNDCWIRDYGGLSVLHKTKKIFYNFSFNAWGKKYPNWIEDDGITKMMALPHKSDIISIDLVLEGGSINSNGKGSLITSYQCLLNSSRNPEKSRWEIETILCECFSLDNIFWLTAKGQLMGDDTDGHVDEMARFSGPNTIMCGTEHNKGDAN